MELFPRAAGDDQKRRAQWFGGATSPEDIGPAFFFGASCFEVWSGELGFEHSGPMENEEQVRNTFEGTKKRRMSGDAVGRRSDRKAGRPCRKPRDFIISVSQEAGNEASCISNVSQFSEKYFSVSLYLPVYF